MNSDERRCASDELTKKIIGCVYTVSNTLGCGFLEKVYENALAHELKKIGLRVEQQHPVPIYYDEIKVGDYVCDMLIEGQVILEMKAVTDLNDNHVAQCLNYLNGAGLRVCLLINFGKPKVEIRRIVRGF